MVGHLTWAALARRETLCAFDHVYTFMREHYNASAVLPGHVREELRILRGLLPLMVRDLGVPWSEQVFCSDASLFAVGACERHLDMTCVGSIGRVSENGDMIVKTPLPHEHPPSAHHMPKTCA